MTSCFDSLKWHAPLDWSRIETIDLHTGGEPLRVYISGLPPIKGNTVLEKRRYFQKFCDHIRTGTIWEPRGHADMYGAIVTDSTCADFDVFFVHNEGYSTMCGHAIIALTTLFVETGLVAGDDHTEVCFSVPAGIVTARAKVAAGKATDVNFRNVPSFVYLQDQEVDIQGLGSVRFDIAYGGAFYAIVDAESLGLELNPEEFTKLVEYGRRIKLAVMQAFRVEHPFEDDLGFLYGTIFTGAPHKVGNHSRNVCVFANGELDRSPTGSGVSARAALHCMKGELQPGEVANIESILGSTMTVRIATLTNFGPYEAVIPEVGGAASIVGRSEFYFDPTDPFRDGFMLR